MIRTDEELKAARQRLDEVYIEAGEIRLACADDQECEHRTAAHRSVAESLSQEIRLYEALRRCEPAALAPFLPVNEADGRTLIALRISAGLTVAGLAARLGLPADVVDRYEQSEYSEATRDSRLTVLDALGVPAELPGSE